jgi:hypothetical protein
VEITRVILSQAAFGALILLLLGCWLSRWKYSYYEDSPVRFNRFSGTTEMRIQYAPKDIDWVTLDDFRDGKPQDQYAKIAFLYAQENQH